MVSPGNNPNQGNQKGGKENSNAADRKTGKDEAGTKSTQGDQHKAPGKVGDSSRDKK